MDIQDKIDFLRNRLLNKLLPLIDNDYVLWDVPYYNNIGDVLIWEGERSFLKESKHQCLDFASAGTCRFPKLSPDAVILLGGGGNFGDLWRWFQEFRLEVIRRYPENRIIIFPQSVYYDDVGVMQSDAELMSCHQKLIICAREQQSYGLLKANFRNEIIFVPDMAFCIPLEDLRRWAIKGHGRVLYLKRMDKELAEDWVFPAGAEVRDWPSMEKKPLPLFFLEKGLGLKRHLEKYKLNFLSVWLTGWIDWYADRVVRPHLVKMGVKFLSGYKYVYTTRLHVMILSVLLGKECEFLDNSYGKNSAFYDTWLKDLPGVKRAE